MNKIITLKKWNKIYPFSVKRSLLLCLGSGVISLSSQAQVAPNVDLSTVPFYQQNFEHLAQIDSMQQDSNFVMTGHFKEPYRAMRIWGPRLYPHGDMSIAAHAYSDYFTDFQSNQINNSSSCNIFDVQWDYVGCNGLPDLSRSVSSAGQINRLAFDPNYNNTTNRTIYGASFFGGLWRTEDNGEHWNVVNTDHQLPYTSVSDVAISPTNSNTIYISTGLGGTDIVSYSSNYSAVNPIFSAGVYKSTDYGQNWSVMNSGLTSYINSDQGLFIRRMIISPFNDNKIAAATSKGLFVCHNANATAPTWDLITSSINSNTTIDESDYQWRGLEFHPTNANTIYASGKDVVRSTDGGLSWQPMTGAGIGLDVNNIGGLASNMINPEVLRINIDVNPSDPNVLYAHLIIGYDKEKITTTTDLNTGVVTTDTTYSYVNDANTVYKFDGTTWEQLINVKRRGCNTSWMAIEADPVNIGTVYFSGIHVQRIVENPSGGFTNPTTISVRSAGKYHDDTHDLEFPPIANPDYLYSANHGGVAKKDVNYLHNTSGWDNISHGIQTQLIWSFDENRFNHNKKAIALQDAGVVISYLDDTDTLRWRQLDDAGDGYAVNIVNDAEDTYICQFNSFHRGYNISFNPNGTPQFIVPFFSKNNFANHPHLHNATYGLDDPGSTYKFKNHSKTDKPIVGARNLYQMEQTIPDANDKYNNPNSDLWSVMSDITKQHGAFQIADWDYAPNDLNNIYVITQNHLTFPSYYAPEDINNWYSGGILYKSTTGFCDGVFGDTTDFRFNYIHNNIVTSYGTAQGLLTALPPITGLAVDPNNSDRLWLSFTGFEDNFKVLISEDGGDTWNSADPTGSLDNLPVNNIVYQQGTNDRLFIATDAGVYYKDASMDCWERYGDIPNVRVLELQINPCNGKLSAATFGRGIWEVDLPSSGTITNNITINQNTTWTGDQYKYSNIIIPDGVTLTVEGFVHMPYHSKIKVLKGGKLIVDGGTLTNNCQADWIGIEVEGDNDLNQFSGNQGEVELKNGARIEYASLGVLLMARTNDGNVDWGTAGGVVRAENTTFYNCRRGAAFMAYDNISPSGNPLRNFSYFKDCTFEFNDEYKETFETSIFPVGISMWGVDGVRVEGCTFKNEMTTVETDGHDKYDGHAIVTADASAEIRPLMSNPPFGQTPQIVKRNSFTGFDLGVYSYGIDNTDILVVRDNIFNDNKLGVYADQSTNLSIVENQFTVPHLGAVSEGYEVRSAGVYLKESYDFEVEENAFLGTSDGNNYDGGFVIENLEPIDPDEPNATVSRHERIFRNTFNDLGFAVLAYGNNGGEYQSSDGQQTWVSGFELKCNDFGQNTNNYQDVYIDTNASILPEQGQLGASTEDPAGNRFSTLPGATLNGHIFMGQGALEINPYIWHGQTQSTDPYKSPTALVVRQPLNEIYSKPLSCPSNIAQDDDDENLVSDFGEIGFITDQISTLKLNYTNILNGGIRAEIMEVLLDDLSTSQQIRDELIQGSPYLDDEILIAAITRQIPLNQWHLTEVLVWNSRLSRNVMNVLNQVQPLTPYQYNLVLNTDGNSQRYLLELEIRKREKKLHRAKSDYILKAWTDESVNIYDEIIKLYENDTDMDSKSKVIDAHLKKKDFTKSDAIINAYIPLNADDKFKAFYTLKSDLVKNSKNWFQMDEDEIRDLETIIDEDKYIVRAKAENVRSLIQEEFVTFTPKPVNLNLPQAKQAYIGKSDDGSSLNDIIEVSYIHNDKDLVFVNTSSAARYIIANSKGQILLEGELPKQVTTLNVDHLHPGIYHIKIQTSDNNTCDETFVVR